MQTRARFCPPYLRVENCVCVVATLVALATWEATKVATTSSKNHFDKLLIRRCHPRFSVRPFCMAGPKHPLWSHRQFIEAHASRAVDSICQGCSRWHDRHLTRPTHTIGSI